MHRLIVGDQGHKSDDCKDGCDEHSICSKGRLSDLNHHKMWCIIHRAPYYGECQLHVQEEIRDLLSLILDHVGGSVMAARAETPPTHILLTETPPALQNDDE